MNTKKTIPSFLLAVLASSSLLVAQNEYDQGTGYRVQGTGLKTEELPSEEHNDLCNLISLFKSSSIPISYLPSSISYLGVAPTLMMNPSTLEEGAEALGKELGVFGERATPSKVGVAATRSSVGNSPSNIAVSPQGAVETTGEENAEENGNAINAFLEDEICNNIYMSCLAKVVGMSKSRGFVAAANSEEAAQEAAEWAAAEKKASNDVRKSEKVLEKAKKETLAAEKKLNSATASLHGKAYADEAYYNFQVKELAEALAEARVATAQATLMAIEVRNTAQSAGAEADLAEAREEEKTAFDALAAATAHTTGEIASSSVVQQKATDSKRPTSLSPNPSSPFSFTPPKPPASELKIEQNFTSTPIPIATAVEVRSSHNFTVAEPLTQQFDQLKISEEKAAKEKAEALALAKKEKVAAFEAEFVTLIEDAKVQAKEAAEVATTAREKAEKLRTSEKDWNDAIKKANKVEASYAHLAEMYKLYQEQAAEHYEGGILKAKRSKYNFALQDSESERDDWRSNVEECTQKKEALNNEAIKKVLSQTPTTEAKDPGEAQNIGVQVAEKKEEFIREKKIFSQAEAAIAQKPEVLETLKKEDKTTEQVNVPNKNIVNANLKSAGENDDETGSVEKDDNETFDQCLAQAEQKMATIDEEKREIETGEYYKSCSQKNKKQADRNLETGLSNYEKALKCFREAKNIGDQKLARLWIEAFDQYYLAASCRKKAAAVLSDRRDPIHQSKTVKFCEENSECWRSAAIYAVRSAEKFKKTISFRNSGKELQTVVYKKVAKKLQEAANLEKQAAEEHIAGKTHQKSSLSNAGYYTSLSAEKMIEASKLREAGKDELALSYDDAAIELDNAVKLRKSAIKAYEREGEELGDEIGKSY
ncbi:MAG TPA: hypothetical protein VJK54_10135, partial [Chthoniobacterales bacterium]|nr:hypothetical protein [Chthoniobacterales bacterium]